MKIKSLKISSVDPENQMRFYRDVLGIGIKKFENGSFEAQIGYSILKFEKDPNSTPYHIAFHIPPEKEEDALTWLKQRTGILTDQGKEIIDFSSWRARSVYFYDSDFNILELISRREFFPSSKECFSAESFLGISEIGLATGNVKEVFQFLHGNFGLRKFTGDYRVFCATGDDQGLFIVIDKDNKDWFPSGDEAFPSSFEAGFETAVGSFRIGYRNERLSML